MTPEKPVIYQLVVRLFSNVVERPVRDGTLEENGVGKLAHIDERALAELKKLGATHVWLTGLLRQATLTDYSALGMPASDPDIVKGRAGSFYAIRDYFDVCPDYALDPANRLAEAEALFERIHRAGLRVLIDLVPNHVSRDYASVVRPELDFGRSDDARRFFLSSNDFFYLVDPPGQVLTLPRPEHWRPAGVDFDGRFAREDGQDGRVPRVTGNNVTSPAPSVGDWYDTVKLNWGFNFAESLSSDARGASSFSPTPSVWTKFDEILAYWQEKGVDGFRVDFAHWVPVEAWRYLLERARQRRSDAFFLAEAYENLEGLLGAGFDAVYCDEVYDTLKRVIWGEPFSRAGALLATPGGGPRSRWAFYLENHDERRIASPIVRGEGPDASGFGSAEVARELAPLVFLATDGPVLFFNGQEVGEEGALDEGYGGADGRTTIFDYGAMPALRDWVNGHAYDGGRLAPERAALRRYYAELLALAQAPEVRGSAHVVLPIDGAAHAFARFEPGAGSLLAIVAPTRADGGAVLRVPAAVLGACGLTGPVEVRELLDHDGARDHVLFHGAAEDLAGIGLTLSQHPGARVLRIAARVVEAPERTTGGRRFVMEAIGVARTPFTDKASAPRQGALAREARGRIELFAGPGIDDALDGLSEFDHVWIIYVFDQRTGGFKPKVTPPRSKRRLGVFATRSPHRPNPIGLTAVRLERIEGRTLHVSGLDLVDGTHVLDLKPYVPYADALLHASSGWLTATDAGPTWTIAWSEAAEERRAWLAERGLELAGPVTQLLSTGPEPHAYRRIKKLPSGVSVLAYRSWRFPFSVAGSTLRVSTIKSGYRPAALASEDASSASEAIDDLQVHRAFVARFGVE
ncbi:MAG: tRNA (N6-threonylcarbamoyladenosine(37)-N6)-methyltransferase TrmO [Polyangiaceae bacterium]